MKDQTNISLDEIGQISVNVHDFDRAVAFYKDTLGMKHLFSVPGRMAFFDCRGIQLMLAIPERPDLDYPSSILYFKVQDIEARRMRHWFREKFISKLSRCWLRRWQRTICGWRNFATRKTTCSL